MGRGLLVLAYYSIVIVTGSEMAVMERRWFGRKMPQARVVAMGNEVGIQAKTLGRPALPGGAQIQV